MKEYHKIQSVFKRQSEKPYKIIENKYSFPEFEYLKDNKWIFYEKINRTNIRVNYKDNIISFGGRTEKSQISTILYNKLNELFKFEIFNSFNFDDICLYGEEFGSDIQQGNNYIFDDVDFILFDIK